MRSATLLIFCIAAAFVSCLAITAGPTDEPPETTETPKITTTPTLPNTTTTQTTTTTSTTTTNTTTTPTTTTTEAKTTTPAPPPAPAPTSDTGKDPVQNSFNVSDSKKYCLLTKMGVRLEFMYQTANKTNETIMYDIRTDAKMMDSSTCGKNLTDNEVLDITFNNDWNMSLTFTYNATSKRWMVNEVSVSFPYSDAVFPGAENATGDMKTANLKNLELFSTPNGSSFQCVSDSQVSNFSNGITGFAMNLTTSNLHVQAFRSANSTNYAMSLPCAADTEVSNIVPIAVGAALAGLVVIVLVAYLIGRRKNRRGYESV